MNKNDNRTIHQIKADIRAFIAKSNQEENETLNAKKLSKLRTSAGK